MQEIALLIFALLLDFIIGDPRSKFHPVCLMGNFAYGIEKYLRYGQNTLGMFLRGALAWFCVIALACTVTFTIVQTAGFLGGTVAEFIACALTLAICMASKSLTQHAKNIIIPLNKGDIQNARQQLAMIVGRDVKDLDAHGVARASIESISENLVDGVLASLFWASIGLYWGFTASALCVVLHRASNVLDAQWGKKNDTYVRFGTFSARMDDALNYIPARLSLLCICLAALLCRIYHAKTWRITGKTELFTVAWKYRYAHASPNSAWSEAAFASALQLSLSGTLSYAGHVIHYPPIGQGTRLATTKHMQESLLLLWLTTFLWIGCTGIIFSVTFLF